MQSISKQLCRQTRRYAALCVAICAAWAVADCAQAEPAATCRYLNLATLPVNLSDLTPAVDGSINHDKTTMLVDSGAQNTLMTKVEMIKLGLSSQPALSGKHKKAAGDDRIDVDELSIGSIQLGKTRMLALQNPADQAVYGALIGADFLFQHDIELSPADQKIKFFKPVGCESGFLAYWDSKASTVDLEEMSPTDHRQIVTVEVNGQKMRALIDTAAPISIINLSAAARAGITPHSTGVTPLTQTAGAGTPPAAWIAPFNHFTIGGETIKNVKIPILNLRGVVKAGTASATPDMLLGADFLHAHHVLFAVSQHLFYFSYLGGNVFSTDTVAQSAAPAHTQ